GPPDPAQPPTTRAARQTPTSPPRRRPIPVPPPVWLLEAVAGHCTAFGNDSHNRYSAAAFAEATQLQAVVGDGEAGPVGDGVQQRGQTGVDLGWDRVVLDAAAAAAHQVMVVPDQLLGQLVAGMPAAGARVAGDRAGLLEDDQVAVDGAHRQAARALGPPADSQRPPPRGATLHHG